MPRIRLTSLLGLIAIAGCSDGVTDPRPAGFWQRADLTSLGGASGPSVLASIKGADGHWAILDPSSGRTLWEIPAAEYPVQRAVVEDLVFEAELVGTNWSMVRTVAHDAQTGAVRWTRVDTAPEYRLPVARVDSTIVEVSYLNQIARVSAATGAVLFRQTVTSGPCAARFGCLREDGQPIFTDGQFTFSVLLTGRESQPGLLIIPPTGEAASVTIPGPFASTFARPLFAGVSRTAGTVVLVGKEHAIGLDAATGALRWTIEFAPNVIPYTSFIAYHAQLADGPGGPVLFVRGTSGTFRPFTLSRVDVVYRVSDGSRVWETRTPQLTEGEFQFAGDCGRNRVVGIRGDGTLDILDIQTRRTASRRSTEIAALFRTSPDDVSFSGQPVASVHPRGVVLVQPYEGRQLTGFSCGS